MRGWVGLALFVVGCSQSAEERGATASGTPATRKLAHGLSAASLSRQAHLIHPLLLKLELRAEDLPSGGQRVVARLPELGIEEALGEGAAPFVCQTTLRPAGGEPTVGGSEWLDVWCGPRGLASVRNRNGVLALGKKELPIPAGRAVSIRKVPQLELGGPPCPSTAAGQVDVRLVRGDHVVKLQVPKLGVSVDVQSGERGGRFTCKSSLLSGGAFMWLSCFDRPGPPSDGIAGVPSRDSFHVLSGVLIVDQTWHDFERSGHQRWGIRLPCGRVKFHGL